MVWWISLAVVLAGLGVLAVLVFDAIGHLRRLERAIDTARADTEPRIAHIYAALPSGDDLPGAR